MTRECAVYYRVSSEAQSFESQEHEMRPWLAVHEPDATVFRDKFTGKTMNRPGWRKLEAAMRDGKIRRLVIYKLDRLGRTARELLALFDNLRAWKVELTSVAGGFMSLDTPEGRLVAGVLAQVAQFDNEIRSERIHAGIAAAKASGKRWGGQKEGQLRSVTTEQIKLIGDCWRDPDYRQNKAHIARAVGCTRTMVSRVIRDQTWARRDLRNPRKRVAC